jgi:hypothetical protein
MRASIALRQELRVVRVAMALGAGGVALACAEVHPPPAFAGRQNDAWIAYEVALAGRDSGDVIESFEASARSYGCTTAHLGTRTDPMLGGEVRSFYGVNATCDATSIALIAEMHGRVVIGCSRPTTRAGCDDLLERISSAR